MRMNKRNSRADGFWKRFIKGKEGVTRRRDGASQGKDRKGEAKRGRGHGGG